MSLEFPICGDGSRLLLLKLFLVVTGHRDLAALDNQEVRRESILSELVIPAPAYARFAGHDDELRLNANDFAGVGMLPRVVGLRHIAINFLGDIASDIAGGLMGKGPDLTEAERPDFLEQRGSINRVTGGRSPPESAGGREVVAEDQDVIVGSIAVRTILATSEVADRPHGASQTPHEVLNIPDPDRPRLGVKIVREGQSEERIVLMQLRLVMDPGCPVSCPIHSTPDALAARNCHFLRTEVTAAIVEGNPARGLRPAPGGIEAGHPSEPDAASHRHSGIEVLSVGARVVFELSAAAAARHLVTSSHQDASPMGTWKVFHVA